MEKPGQAENNPRPRPVQRSTPDLQCPNEPIAACLDGLEGRVSFHTPGHKGALGTWDTTELNITDNALYPQRSILEAEGAAARFFRAGATCFSTCGSSSAVTAMILACVPPGGRLLLPRTSHVSAYNACALGGIEPMHMLPHWDAEADACHITEQAVLAALDACPRAHALLITRPDYYGALLPLARIAEKARAHGTLLLVDEAHGAHLSAIGAEGACAYADVWCQSAHKTLCALTPAALLHARDKAMQPLLRRMLRLVHTTSPSFPVLASIEQARALLASLSAGETAARLNRAAQLRVHILANSALVDYTYILRRIGLDADPLRLVIDTSASMSGYAAQAYLQNAGIDIEMADARRIVCVLSLFDGDEAYDRLAQALSCLPRGEGVPSASRPPVYGEPALGLRAAVFAPSEPVPLQESVGRISAVCAGLYPPGAPCLIPGERVSLAVVHSLMDAREQGASVFGLDNGYLACIAQD